MIPCALSLPSLATHASLPFQVAEANLFAFAVVNAAFLTGLFTFAVFLGIVTDEVKLTFR